MERRRLRLLLAVLALALTGLVAVQVAWTRRTLALREALFSGSVASALEAVSDRVERVDHARDLLGGEAGLRLVLDMDSLRQVQALDAPGTLRPGWAEEQEAMVTALVRDILLSADTHDTRERLDVALIDSLLRVELGQREITGEPFFAVFTTTGELVSPGNADSSHFGALRTSSYRERLFRNDLAGEPCVLHVLVPGSTGHVLRGTWPMLATATVLLLLIAGVFAQAVRTILRQKRLSDIRNDLVNNLTHELKTPISTIALACEALTDPSLPRTEEQVRKYTAMIRDENKRLSALVENVLQSAVEDSGRMVLKPVDLDLHDLVKDVLRSASMQVQRRNGAITLDLAAEAHRVQGDRIHLTNLLYNLIDNAVKYCREEPRVHIATRNDSEGVWLSVQDNGIGIPASEHEKVFDRLYRIPTGNVHNAKGYGLGLSYVRAVARRHGGRVRLESAPGKGSVFHVLIPYEHAGETQTAAR